MAIHFGYGHSRPFAIRFFPCIKTYKNLGGVKPFDSATLKARSEYSIRGLSLKACILLILSSFCVLSAADPVALAPSVIVDQYCAVARGQEQALKGASMEVEIAAALPNLKKHGKLHALRRISSLGRIT